LISYPENSTPVEPAIRSARYEPSRKLLNVSAVFYSLFGATPPDFYSPDPARAKSHHRAAPMFVIFGPAAERAAGHPECLFDLP
jgi:hypothetical protein